MGFGNLAVEVIAIADYSLFAAVGSPRGNRRSLDPAGRIRFAENTFAADWPVAASFDLYHLDFDLAVLIVAGYCSLGILSIGAAAEEGRNYYVVRHSGALREVWVEAVGTRSAAAPVIEVPVAVAEEACSELAAAVAVAESSSGNCRSALKELKVFAAADSAFPLAAGSIGKRSLGWPLLAETGFPQAVWVQTTAAQEGVERIVAVVAAVAVVGTETAESQALVLA